MSFTDADIDLLRVFRVYVQVAMMNQTLSVSETQALSVSETQAVGD